SLSARTKSRPAVATPPSGTLSNDPSVAEFSRKSSLTSPIPPHTVIYFPKCPHTTPPTPRLAHIPSVLRTEIIDLSSPVAELAPAVQGLKIAGSREDIV